MKPCTKEERLGNNKIKRLRSYIAKKESPEKTCWDEARRRGVRLKLNHFRDDYQNNGRKFVARAHGNMRKRM
jgi:hypothetical protein